MFLTSTNDVLRIITGSAVSTIGVQASWVDNASGTYTPGRTNTNITTATTTTVVAAPGASTVRNIKTLQITNNHASSSCVVTIQHFDGTTSVDIEKITLAAGETFVMAEDGEWRHLTAAGGEYEYSQPAPGNLGITGTIAETYPRELCLETNLSLLTSGTMSLCPILLRKGQVATNISFFSATTAAGTPTNQIFGLYSPSLSLIRQTTNDTTTAWAATSIKTLALTSSYEVPVTGIYYVAIMVAATTVPTIKGITRTGSTLTGRPPVMTGGSNSSLTTALPDMATAPSGSVSYPWAAIT